MHKRLACFTECGGDGAEAASARAKELCTGLGSEKVSGTAIHAIFLLGNGS